MTTIYIPRLIETAEQAEALPTGTLARHANGSGMDHAHKIAPIGDPTPLLGWVSLTGLVSNNSMVGWTALVPIEAEEEWTAGNAGLRFPSSTRVAAEAHASNTPDGFIETRLVTPWTPASE